MKLNFYQIMTVLFFAARCFNLIDWSWWWVFSPVWGSWALAAVCAFAKFVKFVRES